LAVSSATALLRSHEIGGHVVAGQVLGLQRGDLQGDRVRGV
jgi:riboflavin synthase alpha subunit